MRGALVFAALALLFLFYQNEQSSVRHPPGILAPGEPFQAALETQPHLVKKGFQIEALARYSLQARVLRTERYHFDRNADLAPVDIALGWGEMSDSAVLDKLVITQGQRFVEINPSGPLPISGRAVELQSANVHMVPANDDVDRILKEVRAGDIVRMSGYLIEARGPKGAYMRSSLTREDTGPGACEVMWVDRIELR